MRDEYKQRSAAEWDLFTLGSGLPAEEFSGEAQLYCSKWFDYRRMHPMAATFELISCYCTHHRHEYARRFDVHEARALNLTPMEEGRHKLLEFWRARRKIDALGVPYDVYSAIACDLAERCWSHLARPEDLTNSFIVSRAQEIWSERKQSRLYYPTDDFYLAVNDCQHPDQQAWREYVSEYFSRRADNTATLAFNARLGPRAWIMPEQASRAA